MMTATRILTMPPSAYSAVVQLRLILFFIVLTYGYWTVHATTSSSSSSRGQTSFVVSPAIPRSRDKVRVRVAKKRQLLAQQPSNDLLDASTTSTSSSSSPLRSGTRTDSYNSYKSRSTSSPDESCPFHEGAQQRAQRLDQALRDIIGIDALAELVQDPIWKGSAALRTYSSFVLPKSAGALAMTQQPQRVAVVANHISFLMREHRAHRDAWIRNHDRSLQEADAIWSLQQQQQQQQSTGSSSNNNSNNNANQRNPITLILDDIRSAANVGNILRCAEAARCQQVLLCGSMTPAPPQTAVLKTAVGAAEYVPFQTVSSTLQAVREWRKQQNNPNHRTLVVGVETTAKSIPLWQVDFFPQCQNQQQQQDDYQIAFVFGNELVGVDTTVLQECDTVVSVPTFGMKNSLNVATCASIIIWEALRQREQQQQVL